MILILFFYKDEDLLSSAGRRNKAYGCTEDRERKRFFWEKEDCQTRMEERSLNADRGGERIDRFLSGTWRTFPVLIYRNF